jgi:hypothetical protein
VRRTINSDDNNINYASTNRRQIISEEFVGRSIEIAFVRVSLSTAA